MVEQLQTHVNIDGFKLCRLQSGHKDLADPSTEVRLSHTTSTLFSRCTIQGLQCGILPPGLLPGLLVIACYLSFTPSSLKFRLVAGWFARLGTFQWTPASKRLHCGKRSQPYLKIL